ncbi:hypothetical protein PUNSTDRAFT_143371 [Punctularia strigosozonata HHB-11173 SS5]|uniref:uncharacterized protein n=1 Tax=Punctularia strigosozonata (strain HHB-11173) TaxID=741275 RepID=UPI0004417AEF|nr:uncharacterized protein PUNSTDRAFT_143371 [Punctularia strigosozonata HHB-11173 SS5]EIN10022.1 hypothetical protein PUNSTDRAFT_143371 [Punctularia strigosozonata HHB-11173 SS5]
MARFSFLQVFLFANVALMAAAQGTKFITEACAADSECASGCCGFNSGLCAGAVIAQERDGGCGHGDAFPNNNAAVALLGPNAEAAPGVPKAGVTTAAAADNAAAATTSVAAAAATSAAATSAAPGTKFITEACASDSECASSCCGFNSGKCAAGVVAQERDGGCGHGDAVPNNIAAQKIQGPNAEKAPGVPRARMLRNVMRV